MMETRDTTVTAQTLKPTNYEMKIAQPGTTYAIRDVELEARVNGYIEAVDFNDGAIVKKGDRLFQIDPKKRRLEFVYALHDEAINAVHLSAGFAVTGSADHTLRVWPLDFASHFLEAEHEGAVTTARHPARTQLSPSSRPALT